MKAKKDEVQALLDGLDQDVKDLIAKRDAEILAAAKAEEEARRAAEEAAKQQASGGGARHSGQWPGIVRRGQPAAACCGVVQEDAVPRRGSLRLVGFRRV